MYRLVHDETCGPGAFRSSREEGKEAKGRALICSDLLDGVSVYASEAAARERWGINSRLAEARGEELKSGSRIVEVELMPDQGFEIEDLNRKDEHLTIWGDSSKLANAVRRNFPAAE